MNHSDCVKLLENGVPAQSRVWAEFGSGDGAFTLALAELICPNGIIYSVDINERALNQQKKEMQKQFPDLKAHYQIADFTKPLALNHNLLVDYTYDSTVSKLEFSSGGAHEITVIYNFSLPDRPGPVKCPFKEWWRLGMGLQHFRK